MTTGIEVGLRRGFHRLTHRDYGVAGRELLSKQPSCEFEAMEAGKSYYYKPTHGASHILTVVRISLSRARPE